MKNPVLLIVAFMALSDTLHAQITLSGGEAFTFEFASLPLVGVTAPFLSIPNGQWSMAPPAVTFSPVFRLEMFENNTSEAPLASQVYDPVFLGQISVIGNFSPGAWQDLQGVVRITMLSGSAEFGPINIGAHLPNTDGSLRDYGIVLTQVPEPATLGLIAIDALGVGWIQNRRRVAGNHREAFPVS